MFPKLTWPLKRSRSSKGHHLNKLRWAGVSDATYQVSWKSAHRFWRRRFLNVFTIYGRGGHLGHVTKRRRSSEKKIFEIVDDGWTPEHAYTISSPCQPSAQVS